jgi:peptide-methionine (S)-S-oxide reductase
MKKLSLYLFAFLLFSGCANGQTPGNGSIFANLPDPKSNEKVATFAGGCFWSLSEALSELKGVRLVVAGYSGGSVKNPTYEEVCTKLTGHAESVQVYYDPSVISYATLAEAFFYAHDPTTLDRQGPDEGPDYRSIAFYRTADEKRILEEVIDRVNQSHHYGEPIVTKVMPFKVLYAAENYHQGYYRLHGNNPYIQYVSVPKVLKLRRAMNSNLKPEFQNNANN